MYYKSTTGEKVFDVVNYVVLGVVGLIAVYPFVYVLSISLSTATEAMSGGLHLYPREISLTSYKMVLTNPEILTGYLNSLFRTIVGTILTVLATCVAAYPLAFKRLPHRRFLILFLLFTMIFSGGLVPVYLLIKNIGLMDSRWALILPVLLTAFNIIIVKSFFESIPDSLGESARIDGCGEFGILWRIYMPLSKPVIATVSLWTAVLHWNTWFDAMLYISSDSKQVLQNYLQRIVIENSTDLIEKGLSDPEFTSFTPASIKAATVVIAILPMLIVYPFVQKYFVKGIMLGSVKE